MFVPTCATCHMSGLNGLNVTHDPSERLSYNLFAEVSEKRPQYARAQAAMKDLCRNCHTQPLIDRIYTEAEQVLASTNQKVQEARSIVEGLRKDGVLNGKPFEQPIDFAYFDLWHYYGRTAKHGAFMGGADFVQWHGNYPMLKSTVEIRSLAEEMRRRHGSTKTSWFRNHQLWLEAFILVNLAFLGPDIYVAHSTNLFRHAAEYIPFFFSLVAPLVLLVALLAWKWQASASIWRLLGYFVGWSSVAIGIVGLIFHLESRFFREETLESLVYAAPFAAPLAYTGIGLLLIMNRMVDAESADWPYWVLFLALGGFVGNFIFSLTDHAQNGFFYPSEWMPVASSAFAVGFLMVPFLVRVNRSFLVVCAVVMLVQAVVGLLGFYYHTAANLHGPSPSQFDNFVYGAPAMAPLLFPNLVLLAFLGLWVLRRHVPASDEEQRSDASPLALQQTDS